MTTFTPTVTSSPATARRQLWLLLLVNGLMSLALTWGHTRYATHFLSWQRFMTLDGPQPFQSRLLPFGIAHLVDRLHPLGDTGLSQLFLVYDAIGLFAASMFLWAAWRHLGPRRGRPGTLLLLFWWQLVATFVLSRVHNYAYPWDMLSLGFISAGLWIIIARRPWWWLLPLCIVAMTNRETAVLMAFFYLGFNWPADRTVLSRFTVLLAACLAVKLAISMALDVGTNVVSLEHIPGYPRYLYNFSFLNLSPYWFHTANVFCAFGGVWLLLFMRGEVDRRLRHMALCFIPFLLGLVVVANLSEIRVFAEFIPLMALVLAGKFASRREAAAAAR